MLFLVCLVRRLRFGQILFVCAVVVTTAMGSEARAVLLGEKLLSACAHGSVGYARKLIADGAHVNHSDRQGDTCLIWACIHGHIECVRELLSAGADVHRAGMFGYTALERACKYGHALCGRALVESGATVTQRCANGWYGFMLHNGGDRAIGAITRFTVGQHVSVSVPFLPHRDRWQPGQIVATHTSSGFGYIVRLTSLPEVSGFAVLVDNKQYIRAVRAQRGANNDAHIGPVIDDEMERMREAHDVREAGTADARRNTEKKRREERTTARVAYVKHADPAPWPPQHELNNVDAAHKRAIRSTEKEAAFERIRVQEVDRRRAREREMADAAARLQALRIGDAIVGDNTLPIRDALP